MEMYLVSEQNPEQFHHNLHDFMEKQSKSLLRATLEKSSLCNI